MKTLTVTADPQNQFSTFLMDHLKPIEMRQHWGTSLKTDYFIKPLIQTIKFITDLGEAEHTGDWDLSIKITLWDDDDILQSLETDPGYYVMSIQGSNLLLEDSSGRGTETNGDDSYHILPISQIHTIQVIRN